MPDPVTTAIGVVGGGIVSSFIGADAAEDAADTQADATRQASQQAADTQLKMYFQNREDLAPWREAGGKALTELEGKVFAGPGEFVPSEQPGYQFGYKEFVEKPLLQGASATGKLRSGNILRTLSDRAQNYASMSYDNWLNRWLTKLQPLQSLAGVGQTSASTTAQLGAQTGQGLANNILQSGMAVGNAQAGGIINQANAYTGGIKSVGNTLMDSLILNKIGGQQPNYEPYVPNPGYVGLDYGN